ncbi:MAG TPA: hypothetical protein VK250_09610 [Nitrososphaeraceae archaeon]|nr:hypothetical protein [Nitrososphaeraceae archaeon]
MSERQRVDVSNVIEYYILENGEPEKITHIMVNSLNLKYSGFFWKTKYK